ncbi:class F sortase [Streptomyces sp. SID3343]|uniref:class F sortase n=1 Tax=Streptomyces sp. SID3343 TaxID=2690260 RepID=UPI00136ED86C|nr:class F sortase [Streptomyces sp. SID3343]MYW01015.1 class F sortase [Streptomyces sp. SID3343]
MRDPVPPQEANSTPSSGRMSRGKLVVIAAGVVFLGGFMVKNDLSEDSGPPPQPAAVATQPAAPAPAAVDPADALVMRSSPPVRIKIDRIDVNAPFVGLTLGSSGVLNVPPPTDRNLAGWYKDGVTPGARGNALVLGHVDTMTGPAVFWGLGSLKPGDVVEVTRADASVAKFAVDSVESFPKDDFPDDRVYGKTQDAQLRLITCGGTYDKKSKDYKDNVVVFAHLIAAQKP